MVKSKEKEKATQPIEKISEDHNEASTSIIPSKLKSEKKKKKQTINKESLIPIIQIPSFSEEQIIQYHLMNPSIPSSIKSQYTLPPISIQRKRKRKEIREGEEEQDKPIFSHPLPVIWFDFDNNNSPSSKSIDIGSEIEVESLVGTPSKTFIKPKSKKQNNKKAKIKRINLSTNNINVPEHAFRIENTGNSAAFWLGDLNNSEASSMGYVNQILTNGNEHLKGLNGNENEKETVKVKAPRKSRAKAKEQEKEETVTGETNSNNLNNVDKSVVNGDGDEHEKELNRNEKELNGNENDFQVETVKVKAPRKSRAKAKEKEKEKEKEETSSGRPNENELEIVDKLVVNGNEKDDDTVSNGEVGEKIRVKAPRKSRSKPKEKEEIPISISNDKINNELIHEKEKKNKKSKKSEKEEEVKKTIQIPPEPKTTSKITKRNSQKVFKETSPPPTSTNIIEKKIISNLSDTSSESSSSSSSSKSNLELPLHNTTKSFSTSIIEKVNFKKTINEKSIYNSSTFDKPPPYPILSPQKQSIPILTPSKISTTTTPINNLINGKKRLSLLPSTPILNDNSNPSTPIEKKKKRTSTGGKRGPKWVTETPKVK
ncbi:uncharacterized protein I206_101225 [Kwoniella pini CBS 10737]|uniref:Uncharacterized protein n=1 Tax=Kwoniella pini CBS 10737 TaxID=1296096 RepID=A0A1B9IAX8_9TREE|nr:uncharacterized protein I206_00098 [Kwoniella pini CBS 10737]OCF52802.1 hypothetical protein I206_00098 [Kwoniella pini CBS 10737]